jgi:3-deoxy-D-manno-octulosonic-acid transferase
VAKHGALEIRDTESLERAVAQLLSDGAARDRLVQNARAVLSTHEGATVRAAALVHELKPNQ